MALEKISLQQKAVKFSTILIYIISNFTTKLTTLSALSSLVVRYHEFWQGYTAPCHHHLDIHGNLPLHDCDYPMILCPGQKIVLTDDIHGPRGLNNAAWENVSARIQCDKPRDYMQLPTSQHLKFQVWMTLNINTEMYSK